MRMILCRRPCRSASRSIARITSISELSEASPKRTSSFVSLSIGGRISHFSAGIPSRRRRLATRESPSIEMPPWHQDVRDYGISAEHLGDTGHADAVLRAEPGKGLDVAAQVRQIDSKTWIHRNLQCLVWRKRLPARGNRAGSTRLFRNGISSRNRFFP